MEHISSVVESACCSVNKCLKRPRPQGPNKPHLGLVVSWRCLGEQLRGQQPQLPDVWMTFVSGPCHATSSAQRSTRRQVTIAPRTWARTYIPQIRILLICRASASFTPPLSSTTSQHAQLAHLRPRRSRHVLPGLRPTALRS